MISWLALTELSVTAVRAELTRGEAITVRVHGHSMRPLLRHGALVRLRQVRAGEPRVGDVIAAETDSGLVLHRVTHVGGGQIQTHGDATAAPDPPVSRQSVLAVASGVESRAGIWLPLLAGRPIGVVARGLRRLRTSLRTSLR